MHEFLKKVAKPATEPQNKDEVIETGLHSIQNLPGHSFPEPVVLSGMLTECRMKFVPPISEEDSRAAKIALTQEIAELYERRKDILLTILKDQKQLFEGGAVIWGCVVEANKLLYDPNNHHTLPAAVIYSTDASRETELEQIEVIAKDLQKGGDPDDKELQDFILTTKMDHERILRKELPNRYTYGRAVFYATCLVSPQHLPTGCLTHSFLPLVINFDATEAAMILPSRFWPQRLISFWTTSKQSENASPSQ